MVSSFLTKSLLERTPCVIGTCDIPLPVPRPQGRYRVVIAQRASIQNENFPGQHAKTATRRILNINEIVEAAQHAGFAVHVASFEGKSQAHQIRILQEADIYLSTFGSQWTNAIYQTEGSTGILVYPMGLKEGCRHPSCTPTSQYRYLRIGARAADLRDPQSTKTGW